MLRVVRGIEQCHAPGFHKRPKLLDRGWVHFQFGMVAAAELARISR
jgi:hypothetical protein